MKKIFTLISMMAVALGASAITDPVTYTFDNQASTYALGDNCEPTTYKMDGEEGYSVNYTGESSAKMQVKLAANENIFFEYSNSSTKNNVIKTSKSFVQCDSKNFIINIPVQTGDVIAIKYSAKGSNAAKIEIYGSEPPIEANADAVAECGDKEEEKAVVFSATATKGGTAKIKETNGGMRIYAISINPTSTGITSVKAAAQDGAIYNVAGQKVGSDYKGLVIKNGKKFIQK